ncbi:sugar transferase [Cellulomonas endophytica]|uniref:sugar transferase n=1 Tax=Cellulomonas endophytica TaxID=2494735 RepID=UPI001012D6E1|nr:sugar transferase [Cellulomonas endophytica]
METDSTTRERLLRVPTQRATAGGHVVGAAPGTAARSTDRGEFTVVLLGAELASAVFVLVLSPGSRGSVAMFALTSAALLGAAGLHRARIRLSVLDDLPVLLRTLVASFGAATAMELLLGGTVTATQLPALGLLAVLLVLARTAVYALVRRARRTGHDVHRTLLVGGGALGAQLARSLEDHAFGLHAVGFVDDAPRPASEDRPLPGLGVVAELPALLARHRADTVVVGFSDVPEDVLVDVVRACHGLPVEIYVVPRMWQVATHHRLVADVRGVPLVRLRRPTYRTPSWRLKRGVDAALAALALVVLGPVMLACAVAVRREGGPGVLFRQRRVGLGGRPFTLLKLRSLRPVDESESATHWNIAQDDRLGPVGRFLRRTSLDELPQLWNVLRGDMSLVGPRPERPHFVTRFGAEHEEYVWRHRVPPGLTGWAQVNGLRGDTSIAERARFDNHYIENWSLWLDLKILARTLRCVIGASGG